MFVFIVVCWQVCRSDGQYRWRAWWIPWMWMPCSRWWGWGSKVLCVFLRLNVKNDVETLVPSFWIMFPFDIDCCFQCRAALIQVAKEPCISLFAGVGGLDLGLSQTTWHGFTWQALLNRSSPANPSSAQPWQFVVNTGLPKFGSEVLGNGSQSLSWAMSPS